MNKSPKTIRAEEASAILSHLLDANGTDAQRRKGYRNYAMACCMLEAGLRVGELVQLKCSDLWFNSVPVTSIILSPEIAKNHRERQIPVSHKLSDAIKLLRVHYWLSHDISANDFAFAASNKQKAPSTRQVERIISRASQSVLGFKVHPHTLRHTFASRLMRVTNIRTVQQLLGHASLSSTQVYTHPNSDDLHNAINALG